MAFVLEDRVVETANNPGQGDFELLGAVENSWTFVTGIGNGNTTRYLAVGAEGAEIGIAQVQAGSPDRLLRPGTVKNLDGTTTPVNFTGTVTVACVASVEDVLWRGADGDVPAGGGRDLGTSGDRWRNLWLSGKMTASDADLGVAQHSADLNDVVTTRAFTSTSSTVNIPAEITGTGVGLNLARASGNDQVQLLFSTALGGLSQGIWARGGRSDWQEGDVNTWWRILAENPSGQIPLSGGKNLFEYGNNANGYYVRYADGLQICWAPHSLTLQDNTTNNIAGSFTLPASFLDQNFAVMAIPPSSTGGFINMSAYENVGWFVGTPLSPSSFAIRVRRAPGASYPPDAYIQGAAFCAVGRWF